MADIGTIPEIRGYNRRMAQSMVDKMFFMDKVFDVDVIVDFGCADGTMIQYLSRLFPDFAYVGFDISEAMLDSARANVPDRTVLTADWAEVAAAIAGRRSVLVLSSVIHEVYSYGSEGDVAEFWARVWETGFDYVVMRELVVSKTASRQSDPIAVARVRQLYDRDKIQQWESRWGSLSENWSLTHFFLTYKYSENWPREYKENYLPVALEDMLPLVPPHYFPTHFEHYTLPYLRRIVEADFGVQLQERTHLQMILECRPAAPR
jgi:SAM-dependent methyltransferase